MSVTNLRPQPRPYDHECDDTIPVELNAWEWSLLEQAARRSGIVAAAEVADTMAAQVRNVQFLRNQADIRDACHDEGFTS